MRDDPRTGSVGDGARRTGTPPVPRPVAGESSAPDGEDGRHRTERVPFPLPPPPAGPSPAPGEETGRLELRRYPPKVPGPAAPGPGADRPDPRSDDGAGRGR